MFESEGGVSRAATLLHLPTARRWRASFEYPYLGSGWNPDCFSEDSRLLIRADAHAARIRPEMDALVFQPDAEGAARPRSSLGSRAGSAPVQIEVVMKGQLRQAALRVRPAGDPLGVDYAAILALERGRTESQLAAARELEGPLLGQAPDKEGARQVLGDLVEVLRAEEHASRITLGDLSVSPGGDLVAAVANVSAGGSGRRYGVVIPLDRGGLAAFPFAEKVYGKLVWSLDSRRLYFYALTPSGRDGTVHRLDLDLRNLPARISPTSVPLEELAAPSDAELERQNDERWKEIHHAALAAHFEAPQTLVEFEEGHGLLVSGQVIQLFGTKIQTAEYAEIDAFARAELLHKPVLLRLPDLPDFSRHYIIGMTTGPFVNREDAWKPVRDLDGIGIVPVLLYRDGELVNARFAPPSWLEAYVDRPAPR